MSDDDAYQSLAATLESETGSRAAEEKPRAYRFAKPHEPSAVKQPVIDQQAVKLFEQARQVWHVKLPAGVTPHDLLLPELWKRVAHKLGRNDIVYALANDEGWECELRVERATPSGVEVSISKKMSRSPVALRETMLGNGEFMTKYVQGAWDVLRVKDGVSIIRGHSTESAAIAQWLREQPRRAS